MKLRKNYKNYMKEITEMLGVEIGEVFNLKGNDGKLITIGDYRFMENGLEYSSGSHRWLKSNSLTDLIVGEVGIVKKPWKPKYLDVYYTIDFDGSVIIKEWHDLAEDLLRFRVGNVFKSKEAAEENITAFEAFANQGPDISWRVNNE